ncbi:MAG: lysylphosphatidylglycerol synthase transmembrane domain-containing protein [Verrucomicrobiota bacterium]
MKALVLFVLKLGLTAGFLWWAFSKVDLANPVFTKPGALDFRWLAAGIGCAGGALCLHALRWWCFLRGQRLDVSYGRAVELIMIDGLFNLASVSGLGGDAARIVLLSRTHPGRKLAVAASVVADHIAGLVTITLWFFLFSAARFADLAAPSALGEKVIHFAWFYFGGGLALVILMFVCASPPVHALIHRNDRFARWPVLKRMPEMCDVFRRRWKHSLAGLACSVPMLATYSLAFYCGLRAIGAVTAPATVLTVMPVVDAISGLPVSVAGIGVREKIFQVLAGDLGGVSAADAVAASLAGFACNAVWALGGAFFFLKKSDRVSRAEMQRTTAEL